MGCIFAHFVYKGSFRQIWVKIRENDPLDLKISILVFVSLIMVFTFVQFEYKDFLAYFGKIYYIQGFSFV